MSGPVSGFLVSQIGHDLGDAVRAIHRAPTTDALPAGTEVVASGPGGERKRSRTGGAAGPGRAEAARPPAGRGRAPWYRRRLPDPRTGPLPQAAGARRAVGCAVLGPRCSVRWWRRRRRLAYQGQGGAALVDASYGRSQRHGSGRPQLDCRLRPAPRTRGRRPGRWPNRAAPCPRR